MIKIAKGYREMLPMATHHDRKWIPYMTRWTIWWTIPDMLPQPMFPTIPFAARGLCHHRYPLRVKSYARQPYLGSFCPLSVSSRKKMGKKDENLAHFCEQNFTHACLHTLHWPHNLCDAAIRHGILFPRLSSTNNVFFNDFPKVFTPFVRFHMKISFAQRFLRNSRNLHFLVCFVPTLHAP